MPSYPPPLDNPALAPVWAGSLYLREGAAEAEAVRALQQALGALFFVISPSGVFDAATARLVKVMQAARGLDVDGVVGEQTLSGLADALSGPALEQLGHRSDLNDVILKPLPGEPLPGLYRGDVFDRRIALTFDDGPHPTRTDDILDILRRAGLKATFFVQGYHVEEHPEEVRRIVSEGHALGNHSWDHPDFMELTDAEIADQLQRARAAVREATGLDFDPTVRPPYGSPFHSDSPPAGDDHARVGAVIDAWASGLSMWQVDTWDWKYQGHPELVVQRFMAELEAEGGGGALLMHDIHQQTVEALPGVLDVLRQRDYAVIGELDLLVEKYLGRQSPPGGRPTLPSGLAGATPIDTTPLEPPGSGGGGGFSGWLAGLWGRIKGGVGV